MMQNRRTKRLLKNSFLLSALLHIALLLFLINISLVVTNKPKPYLQKKPPQLYIPSYAFTGAMTPPAQQSAQNKSSPTTQQKTPSATVQPQRSKKMSISTKRSAPPQESIMNLSRNFLHQDQMRTAVNNLKNTEPPILLVGDKHAVVDPLAKLIGRSLSAHFAYPRIEGSFGATGRVYVELVIHPEGFFSDVQIVQSSNNQDFDAAALYAVNTAPTVVGVDKFLPRPQRFVVGFIFDN